MHAIDDDDAKVRRWTKSIDVFKKDYLLVPINKHMHWSLAVVCFPGCEDTTNKNKNTINTITNTTSTSRHHTSSIKEIVDLSTDPADEDAKDHPDSVTMDTRGRQPQVSELSPNTHTRFETGSPPPSPLEDAGAAAAQALAAEAASAEGIGGAPLKDDDDDDDDPPAPCILFFDSLNAHPAKEICARLRSYLTHEWRARRSRLSGGTAAAAAAVDNDNNNTERMNDKDRVFTHKSMPRVHPRVPKQDNSFDCGVFLLEYAEQVLKRLPHISRQDIANNLDSIFRRDLFNADVIMMKRACIRSVIDDIGGGGASGTQLQLQCAEDEKKRSEDVVCANNDNNAASCVLPHERNKSPTQQMTTVLPSCIDVTGSPSRDDSASITISDL